MRDLFRDALCREPGRDPRDWDVDAAPETSAHAAVVCGACPVVEVCAARAEQLGDLASGVWAGVFRDWTDPGDPVAAAFDAIFGPHFQVAVTVEVVQMTLWAEAQ